MAFVSNLRSVSWRNGNNSTISLINSGIWPRGPDFWNMNFLKILSTNGIGNDQIIINASLFGRRFTPQPFSSSGIQNPTIWGTFQLGPGYIGEPYQEQWFLENVRQPAVFTLQSGTLPPGLTLTNIGTTALGQIAGIPTTEGDYTFILRAQTPDTIADKTLSISIAVARPLVWGDFEFGPGYVGKNYQEQWFLENVSQPVVFSVIDGTLPPGLTLTNIGTTAQGQIGGIPTASGDYPFTIRAQGPSAQADKIFQISIFGYPPVWGDFDFPPATLGIEYGFVWFLENVTFPVTYAITDGALPNGLTLETTDAESGGRISGMATELGTSNFTIRATNSEGIADKVATIVVIDDPNTSSGYIFGN